MNNATNEYKVNVVMGQKLCILNAGVLFVEIA